MLNKLRNELTKDDEITTVENYDLEEIISTVEDYHTSFGALETDITNAEVLVPILNNLERTISKEALTVTDMESANVAIHILTGDSNIIGLESDNNKIINFIKRVVEYIKNALAGIWKRIKVVITKVIEYVKKYVSTMLSNHRLNRFLKLCKEKRIDTSKIKYTEEEMKKIINESYIYSYNRKLSINTLEYHQNFYGDMCNDIMGVIMELTGSKLTVGNFAKVLESIKRRLSDLKLFDYSEGVFYGYSPSLNDLTKVGKLKPDEVRTVEPITCRGIERLKKILTIKNKKIKDYVENLDVFDRVMTNKLKDIAYNVNKFASEKNVDENILKVWEEYRKIVLVVVPKLIKLSLIAIRYNQAPVIKTWLNITYDKVTNKDNESNK